MPRVLLDACVLFPPLVRSILIQVADAGLFQPLWSERIFDEWRLAVARKHGMDAEFEVSAAQTVLHAQYPAACVRADSDLEDQIMLPDPADAHVLAAAVSGKANILMTFNLRDFPQRVVADHGIHVTHPDGYLWQLLSQSPDTVAQATQAALDTTAIPIARSRSFLKRARLSRFGKALEALGPV